MSSRIKKLKNNAVANNSGFTLVEMIVGFMLLSVVAICVFMIVSAGSNMFTRTNRQINLQYKSQNAMAQFQQYFMNCSKGITPMEDGVVYFADENYVYGFRFSEEDQEIYFGQCALSAHPELSFTSDKITDPLCSDVSAFTVTPMSTAKGSSVTVNLTVADSKGSFAATQVFTFRNVPKLFARNEENEGDTLISAFIALINE